MNRKPTGAKAPINGTEKTLTVYDSALYGMVCPLSEVETLIDIVEQDALMKAAKLVRDSFPLTMDSKVSAMAEEKYQLIINALK